MKRIPIAAVLVFMIALLCVIPVQAQDEDVVTYYVDENYNLQGKLCEDGSMQCPFNTEDEAIDKGRKEVCEDQPFYVYLKCRGDRNYPDTPDAYWGGKPVPELGLPLARVAQIVLLTLAGLVLLALALRLQRRKATQ